MFVPLAEAVHPHTCGILYLVGELHTGGLERQLYSLLRAMDRDRYRPAVAVWNYSAGDVHAQLVRAMGVPVYTIANALPRAAKLAAFRRLVRQLTPEVVHSYSFHTNVAAWWAVRGTAAVAVGSIRSDFNWAKKGSGPLLGRLSARWPTFQIANSVSAAASVGASRSYFAPKKCDVVANGLPLDTFFSVPPPTTPPVRIAGIGYLLPIKRWDRLLRAAQELTRRGLDYRIAIFGGGPLRDQLERQVETLGLRDRVRLEDHTDDIPGVLAASSFVVLTSESEGCPNAIMEAMACGRAVIATDVGDIPNLVTDGQTGFVVRSGDHTMLVDRMERMMTDPDLCARMGRMGRQKAESAFGVDRLVRQTLSAYRRAGWRERESVRAGLEALAGDERWTR